MNDHGKFVVASILLPLLAGGNGLAQTAAAPPPVTGNCGMQLGGIAIFLSFLLSLGIALLVSSLRSRLSLGSSIETLATILGPGLLIFLLGVYDDMRGASPFFAKYQKQPERRGR